MKNGLIETRFLLAPSRVEPFASVLITIVRLMSALQPGCTERASLRQINSDGGAPAPLATSAQPRAARDRTLTGISPRPSHIAHRLSRQRPQGLRHIPLPRIRRLELRQVPQNLLLAAGDQRLPGGPCFVIRA